VCVRAYAWVGGGVRESVCVCATERVYVLVCVRERVCDIKCACMCV